MSEIHGVDILAINWPVDGDGELVTDGSQDRELQQVLGFFLNSGMKPAWPEAKAVLQHMAREYDRRIRVYPPYALPPKSALVVKTAPWLRSLGNPGELAPLKNRDETLVYTMKMKPDKCRREDPYTGTQFLYDYCYCRSGALATQKFRNLVLRFPLITRRIWQQNNPNYNERKSSNWYLTANAMVFKDSAKLLRVSEA